MNLLTYSKPQHGPVGPTIIIRRRLDISGAYQRTWDTFHIEVPMHVIVLSKRHISQHHTDNFVVEPLIYGMKVFGHRQHCKGMIMSPIII